MTDRRDEKVTIHIYHGGGSATCKCRCPDGPCEHVWDGWYEFEDGLGATATCSRCGMHAMSHDMRVGP